MGTRRTRLLLLIGFKAICEDDVPRKYVCKSCY